MSNNEWLGFNPAETEAAESFRGGQEPVPNGRYQAIATSAVRKHTKKGDGWFWELTFTIAEGQYEGRTIVHRFNMVNPSEEAVAIGRSHMKRYLDAIGNLHPQDERDLCNIVVWIEVECKKNSYTNRKGEPAEGINSEIVKIDPYSNAPPPPKAAATGQTSVPPWKR
ncbi:MAG: DUF669 domain-containing protein [Planctomycetaceae bacterium]|nr:DUF669 domain-containing protein [Planctomycetaceae bacterium]